MSHSTDLSPAQRRRIFTLIAEQLRRRGKQDLELFHAVLNIVKEYDAETDPKLRAESAEAAVELLMLGILLVEVATFDQILQFESVQKVRYYSRETRTQCTTEY